MDKLLPPAHFLRILSLAFAAICLLAAFLNLAVDPYGIFSTPRISGFNLIKPAAGERVRVAKPYMVEATTAHTIIGGNSRPEIGLDPESECWAADHLPTFNMGVPGAGVRTQLDYVRTAVESAGAGRALLAIDFLDFLVDTSQPQQRPTPSSKDSSAPKQPDNRPSTSPNLTQRLKDYFNALFSLETLADSVTTIAMQQRAHAATRRDDGFNPARDYIPIIRAEGQAVLFQQKSREVARLFNRPQLGIYNIDSHDSGPFIALRHFLTWADAKKLEVEVFINPYHAHYLALIELAGKWELLEQWKREILAITSTHGVPVWDFNALDAYTGESPPSPENKDTVLRWFWEPAHYRKEYGDLMLASIENLSCAPTKSHPKIGTLVTLSNVDDHLRDLRNALIAYQAGHPDEFAMLSDLVSFKE